MLENGWVQNVDRDYAEYVGREPTINDMDIGDYRISDFIYERDLILELGRKLTGAYDTNEVIQQLVEWLRNTSQYKAMVEKAEYRLVEDEHSGEFDSYMEGYNR